MSDNEKPPLENLQSITSEKNPEIKLDAGFFGKYYENILDCLVKEKVFLSRQNVSHYLLKLIFLNFFSHLSIIIASKLIASFIKLKIRVLVINLLLNVTNYRGHVVKKKKMMII